MKVIKFLDPSGTVQIGVKNNNFIIKKDYETVIIRLLEGDFPEYGDIIQRGSSYAIHLDRKKFLMMLKRMSILSSEDYKGVIFNFRDANTMQPLMDIQMSNETRIVTPRYMNCLSENFLYITRVPCQKNLLVDAYMVDMSTRRDMAIISRKR